jgi:hypothetical protein
MNDCNSMRNARSYPLLLSCTNFSINGLTSHWCIVCSILCQLSLFFCQDFFLSIFFGSSLLVVFLSASFCCPSIVSRECILVLRAHGRIPTGYAHSAAVFTTCVDDHETKTKLLGNLAISEADKSINNQSIYWYKQTNKQWTVG